MKSPMSTKDLDMSISWDNHPPPDPSLEFNSTPERVTDNVFWASTQPPQLQSILVEVTKAKSRRQLEPETTSPWCEPSTYTPSFEFPSTKQPLARTNSSRRLGLNSFAGPNSATAPPTSDFDFFHQKGSTWGGASEQKNENAMRSAKSEDGSFMKRRIWSGDGNAEASVSKTRRKGMSVSVDPADEGHLHERSSLKGKQKETVQRSRKADNRLSMRSCSSSSSSSTAMSSSSLQTVNDSISMDVEIADASVMDIDVDVGEQSSSAAPFLPPVIKTTSSLLRNRSGLSKATMSHLSLDKYTAPKPIPPVPKLHPLLTEQHSRRERTALAPPVPRPPPQMKPPPPPERNALPALSLSQSTRPPPLGMRRAHTIPSAATTTSNPLPTRQKGFRPPLLSQPQSQRSQAQADVVRSHQQQQFTRSAAGHQVQVVQPAPADRMRPQLNVHPPAPVIARRVAPAIEETPHPGKLARAAKISPSPRSSQDEQEATRGSSPDINPEADSSFGDMSFDMDALEETMRMYD